MFVVRDVLTTSLPLTINIVFDMEYPSSNCLLDYLPNELLLDIISIACDSQGAYRTTLLLNRRFHHLTKSAIILRRIPIHISFENMACFLREMEAAPSIGYTLRYLWINGTSQACTHLAQACPNLISLACTRTVVYSLCSEIRDDIRHKYLRELTIFDNHEIWGPLMQRPLTYKVFAGITHLRLHNQPTGDFNHRLFPALTHISLPIRTDIRFSGRKLEIELATSEMMKIRSMTTLQHIVITTFLWKSEPADHDTIAALEIEPRVRFVFFGADEPGEFALWGGRARGEQCIWTTRSEMRQLC